MKSTLHRNKVRFCSYCYCLILHPGAISVSSSKTADCPLCRQTNVTRALSYLNRSNLVGGIWNFGSTVVRAMNRAAFPFTQAHFNLRRPSLTQSPGTPNPEERCDWNKNAQPQDATAPQSLGGKLIGQNLHVGSSNSKATLTSSGEVRSARATLHPTSLPVWGLMRTIS
jgi:hypothetical protein